VTKEDRLSKLIDWYGGDELAANVLLDKYLLDTESSPEEMWDRIAKEVSKIEKEEKRGVIQKEFRDILDNFKFIPAGRMLYGLGREENVTYMNCYVVPIRETIDYERIPSDYIPVVRAYLKIGRNFDKIIQYLEDNDYFVGKYESWGVEEVEKFKSDYTQPEAIIDKYVIPADSLEGIYTWLKESSAVYRSGGGVGVDLSVLRPKGTPVKNSGGVSPGAVSFMDLMSRSTHTVHQKLRRGALILGISSKHPDLLDFINVKKILGKIEYVDKEANENKNNLYKLVENANISVLVDNEFMQAVVNGEDYEQCWPINSDNPKIKKKVSAKKIWKEIIKNAHEHAEPGILFIDNHRVNDSLWYINPATVSNPCIHGDTLIAVADGRNHISIQQLAEEKKDVLVFCYGNGKIQTRVGRNPRKTKTNQKLLEIFLDDGNSIKTTYDHKFILHDETFIEAKDLNIGNELLSYNTDNIPYVVTNIEEVEGLHDVYNITVDNFHNYLVKTDINNKNSINGIIIKNCGEQILGEFSACCLGHINVDRYVVNNKEFDFENFEKDVKIAVRFLDNIIDCNKGRHALPQQEEVSLNERRIGLGITGLADCFLRLKIKYDSEEALMFTEKLMTSFRDFSYKASVELAKEKGTFPWFDFEKWVKAEFNQRMVSENDESIKKDLEKTGIRNSFLTSIAPCGSISIIAGRRDENNKGYGGVSSSLEPIFATSYTRRVRQSDGETFKKYKTYPSIIKELFGDDQNLPDYVVTAHQIDPYYRIKLQSVIGSKIANSVSSTLNLKNDVKEEVVEDIYMNAWKMGLKSVTVYREGSREGVLITNEQENKDKENKESKDIVEVKQQVKKIVRPITLSGLTYKIPHNPEENIYVTINSRGDDPTKPFEIFLGTFGQDNPELQTITVLLSALMRNVDDIKFIIEDLKKITSSGQGKWWHDVEDKRRYYINSVPTAVAIALEKFMNRNMIKDKQIIQLEDIDEDHLEKCPKCGSMSYINENGCAHCINKDCGFEKCS